PWRMKITSGGQLLAFAPRSYLVGATSCRGSAELTASMAVAGSRLTIMWAPAGVPLRPDCASGGIYTWRAAGKALTLRRTDDECYPRWLLFAGDPGFIGVWKKS